MENEVEGDQPIPKVPKVHIREAQMRPNQKARFVEEDKQSQVA
jgi:hypothetical protein